MRRLRYGMRGDGWNLDFKGVVRCEECDWHMLFFGGVSLMAEFLCTWTVMCFFVQWLGFASFFRWGVYPWCFYWHSV